MLSLLLLLAAGDPPRPTGITYTSKLPATELQACVARYWSARARVTPIPTKDGVAFDILMRGFSLGGPGQAPLTMEVNSAGESARITASYRRPWSRKTAIGLLGDTLKRCDPAAVIENAETLSEH